MKSVPKPFLFNALKHHLRTVIEFIDQFYASGSDKSPDLALIGNSQMDLYTGTLSVLEIVNDIDKFLSNRISIDKYNYIQFILENNSYINARASDGSGWVLRVGSETDRFIHFHPARYSLHSVRITANSLKSIVAAGALYGRPIGLEQINQARQELLRLDPIKELVPDSGIGRFLPLFNTQIPLNA